MRKFIDSDSNTTIETVRSLISFFSICRRLVDIDDIIDMQDVEFEPNIPQNEWDVIKEDLKRPPNTILQSFWMILNQHKRVFELVHNEDFIKRVSVLFVYEAKYSGTDRIWSRCSSG